MYDERAVRRGYAFEYTYDMPYLWQQELQQIFYTIPVPVAMSVALPNPGDYKAMDAVGMPVLITRGKDGTVRAFLNVCSHRGAPLADEGHGNCPRFTCKYHGWTFGQDGKLIGVAEASTFGQIDKAELDSLMERIGLAERETFSDKRSISEASRIVGKAEKSSGRSMNSVTVSIRIASAKDRARPRSSTQAGTGLSPRTSPNPANGKHLESGPGADAPEEQ